MCDNRRLGLSNSGITQFLETNGVKETRRWFDKGYSEVQRYDEVYAEWLEIPTSIKTTTIKPSGSVSLLAGVAPGCHYSMFEYYIRRMRIGEDSPILPFLYVAGYNIVDDIYSMYTKVVEFPIYSGESKVESDLSIWEQLELASLLQETWSDNGVSITVKFDRFNTSKEEIAKSLEYYQYKLKAVSFLPNIDEGQYELMPYEGITKETYIEMIANINPIDLSTMTQNSHEIDELYCSTDSCEVKSFTN